MRLGFRPEGSPESTGMRVGVIDVGSNTVRLLVAAVQGDTVAAIREERAYLGLGAELLIHGRVRRRKLDEVGRCDPHVRPDRAKARRPRAGGGGHGARQTGRLRPRCWNGFGATPRRRSASSRRRRRDGSRSPAPSRAPIPATASSRVCDVGGGSTEVVVGTRLIGPAWVRSVDVGSLRLTAATLHADPPTRAEIAAARRAVRDAFAAVEPPQPEVALATGGSARAVAQIVGRDYGVEEIEHVVRVVAEATVTRRRRTARVEARARAHAARGRAPARRGLPTPAASGSVPRAAGDASRGSRAAPGTPPRRRLATI